ncbi:MAG: UDP-glucose 4-epimerase GalE [Phycisphaerae bacterium]
MSDKQILVCGGAGYVGSHVVRALQNAGRRCVVLDDLSTGNRGSLPSESECIVASLAQRDVLDDIFRTRDISAVIHLCAHAYVGESAVNPAKYYRNNVANGLVLLEAMIEHDVRRIVFSSSCSVYGRRAGAALLSEELPREPISPYGRTKAAFEQMLEDFESAYGLRWMALRYFNAAGADESGEIGEDHDPETHLIPIILRRALAAERSENASTIEPVEVFGDDYDTPDGTCIRDYVHVTDLADAHVRAVEHMESGETSMPVNLANSRGFSVLEVLETCRRVTGQNIPHRVVPRRPGDPDMLVGDATRATEVLGWRPERDLSEIIRTAWNWHRSHPRGFESTPEVEAAPSEPTIAIFGMGYVGSACAAYLCGRGCRVLAVELSAEKRALLARGQASVSEKGISERLHAAHRNGLLQIADAADAVAASDMSIICVGTPTSPDGDVDLTGVFSAGREIASAISEKNDFHLVVVRSTCPPGTCERLEAAIAKASGKRAGRDFAVVHHPEFLREGSALADMAAPVLAVCGAGDDRFARLLRTAYGPAGERIRVISRRASEMLKYACNAFHAAKVAFANEIGELCRQCGADPQEVMDTFCLDKHLNISSKYLHPGFAFGGSCLPKDVRALKRTAQRTQLNLPLLGSLHASNDARIEQALERILAIDSGGDVGLAGLTFKPGTDDLRESPYLRLAALLRDRGRRVWLHDPAVKLDKLLGANREYMLKLFPSPEKVLVGGIADFLNRAQIIVVRSQADGFVRHEDVREDQLLLDLSNSCAIVTKNGLYCSSEPEGERQFEASAGKPPLSLAPDSR